MDLAGDVLFKQYWMMSIAFVHASSSICVTLEQTCSPFSRMRCLITVLKTFAYRKIIALV